MVALVACTCRRSAPFEIDPLQRCEKNSAWTPDEGRGIVCHGPRLGLDAGTRGGEPSVYRRDVFRQEGS